MTRIREEEEQHIAKRLDEHTSCWHGTHLLVKSETNGC